MQTAVLKILCIILLTSISARAKDIDLTSTAEKKKAVISGVLNPASLSFNGQEIEQSAESYEALLVNDQEIKVNDVSGLKTFYESIDSDSFELKWKRKNGDTKFILKVEYPAVTELKFVNGRIAFKFNEATERARFDSVDLDLKNPVVEIGDVHSWSNELHSLEISSKKNVSQIFNLDFRKFAKEILTTHSFLLMIGDAPFSGNIRPTMIVAGYRERDEDNFSKEVVAAFGKTSYDLGWGATVNPTTQQAVEFKFRYGYDPFKTNSGNFDYKRVTVGLQAEVVGYKRTSQFQTMLDGYNSDVVDTTFYQGGYFIRWEPLQYENYGLVVNFDNRVFRSQNSFSGDRDQKYIGLSYSF